MILVSELKKKSKAIWVRRKLGVRVWNALSLELHPWHHLAPE